MHRVSGKPPKEWIDDALLTQVKIELKYTEKSVARISDDNNFPNPSFFSKFFKRLAGLTPLEYREG
ncbi:MAG: helix-turn-helix domain-containing protein [Alloprevotella sp.]|nr:helix-turn-helix domain-containing protein [Alloprevotella sp.]